MGIVDFGVTVDEMNTINDRDCGTIMEIYPKHSPPSFHAIRYAGAVLPSVFEWVMLLAKR